MWPDNNSTGMSMDDVDDDCQGGPFRCGGQDRTTVLLVTFVLLVVCATIVCLQCLCVECIAAWRYSESSDGLSAEDLRRKDLVKASLRVCRAALPENNVDQAHVNPRTSSRGGTNEDEEAPLPANEPPDIEPEPCPICMEDMMRGELLCQSANEVCTHKFHYLCLARWLMRQSECPVCRAEYISPSL